jgi:hypothetical protein
LEDAIGAEVGYDRVKARGAGVEDGAGEDVGVDYGDVVRLGEEGGDG